MKKLYLASSSPRRYELLQQINIPFTVIASNIDETPFPNESPHIYVSRLADAKAKAGFAKLPLIQQKMACVLAADTTVSINNEILGKPSSQQQAVTMLAKLSGKTHKVFTAIALYYSNNLVSKTLITEVTMRSISPEEAIAYWQTGEPKDKAGGYAIQGLAAMFIEYIHGDYYTVVGLPLFSTAELLKRAGIYSLTNDNYQDHHDH